MISPLLAQGLAKTKVIRSQPEDLEACVQCIQFDPKDTQLSDYRFSALFTERSTA
ncbi:MAG: hypothetical protein P8I38_08075 [Arenicella sp.]|nr:hypothetical protein [Arenicella sp.]